MREAMCGAANRRYVSCNTKESKEPSVHHYSGMYNFTIFNLPQFMCVYNWFNLAKFCMSCLFLLWVCVCRAPPEKSPCQAPGCCLLVSQTHTQRTVLYANNNCTVASTSQRSIHFCSYIYNAVTQNDRLSNSVKIVSATISIHATFTTTQQRTSAPNHPHTAGTRMPSVSECKRNAQIITNYQISQFY